MVNYREKNSLINNICEGLFLGTVVAVFLFGSDLLFRNRIPVPDNVLIKFIRLKEYDFPLIINAFGIYIVIGVIAGVVAGVLKPIGRRWFGSAIIGSIVGIIFCGLIIPMFSDTTVLSSKSHWILSSIIGSILGAVVGIGVRAYLIMKAE